MKISMQSALVPLFSLTLVLSALLLFIVQPMFSKMILPLLGGSPSVWNTAMVFFQAFLLAGYAYAHLTTKFLTIRAQAILHIVLFLLFSFFLPIMIPEGTVPPETNNPAFWQIGLMALVVGGPFFVLAGTAPMVQRWFAGTSHKDAHNPYFLYAASNTGSMGALLLYPVLFEPLMTIETQSVGWAAAYGLLIALLLACALLQQKTKAPVSKDAPNENTSAAQSADKPGAKLILLWLALAFVPSSLMLGVTTYITTDVASAPLLWVVPLALYVGTFIIVFAKKPIVSLKQLHNWHAIAFIIVAAKFITGFHFNILIHVIMHLGLFTLTTLLCHMQLAALRPAARHLTVFYLIMSLGGVLGGMFNALLAPLVFIVPMEYPLIMGLALLLRHVAVASEDGERHYIAQDYNFEYIKRRLFSKSVLRGLSAIIVTVCAVFIAYIMKHGNDGSLAVSFIVSVFFFASLMLLVFYMDKRWRFACLGIAIILFTPILHWAMEGDVLVRKRNFFGAMYVANKPGSDMRVFMHGTTLHGGQSLQEEYKTTPITYYYNRFTTVAELFELFDQKQGPQKVATIGLGTGMLACYTKDERSFRFYEIDPDVALIAENPDYFTYLSDCGSPYEIVIGDGRLKIEQSDSKYDMLFLDAFSSDNIPVHLLTVESFESYLAKLNEGGVLATHISNRHLDLRPVLAATAEELGLHYAFKTSAHGTDEDTGIQYLSTTLGVFARTPEFPERLKNQFEGWKSFTPEEIDIKPWRDNFSNILSAMYMPWQERVIAVDEESFEKAKAKEEENETNTSTD